MKLEDYKFEVAFEIFMLIFSWFVVPFFGIDKVEIVQWNATITSTLIVLAVASIKQHVSNSVNQKRFRVEILSEIDQTLEMLEGEFLSLGKAKLLEVKQYMKNLQKGKIHLDKESYFHRIIEKTQNAANFKYNIFAVSSCHPLRWIDDPQQVRYFEENKIAANKGVLINRVFILSREFLSQVNNETLIKIKKIITEQQQCNNISVSIVWRESLEKNSKYDKDWVLFKNNPGEYYIDYPDLLDPTRVKAGNLYTDSSVITAALEEFAILRSSACSANDLSEVFDKK